MSQVLTHCLIHSDTSRFYDIEADEDPAQACHIPHSPSVARKVRPSVQSLSENNQLAPHQSMQTEMDQLAQ
jgi:hypothetical protein